MRERKYRDARAALKKHGMHHNDPQNERTPISETPFADLVKGKVGVEQQFEEPQYANNIFMEVDMPPIQREADTLAELIHSGRTLKRVEKDAWAEIEHQRNKIGELRDTATLTNYSLCADLANTTLALGSKIVHDKPKVASRGLRLLSGFDDAEIT